MAKPSLLSMIMQPHIPRRKQNYRSFSALLSVVTPPVGQQDGNEDEDKAITPLDTSHVLQVKACVTKNEGTAIGFYLFQPKQSSSCGDSNTDRTWVRGSAYFNLPRSAFEASYSAILSSLEYISQQNKQVKSVTVQCDVDTVVHQLNGKLEIQRESLQTLYEKVMKIEQECFDRVRFECIPTRQNNQATELAQKALDSKTLMIYHSYNMTDPMLGVENRPAANGTPALKTTKGRRLSKSSKETLAKEREDNDDAFIDDVEQPAVKRTKTAAKGLARQTKKAPKEEKRAAAIDTMQSQINKENVTGQSPNVTLPSGPCVCQDHIYILEFDGGSRGNPFGEAGAGMVLYDTGPDGLEKDEVWAGWNYFGRGQMTNNQAEYSGLIAGLEAALARGVRKIVILGDSQLIIRHISGEYRVRNEKLKPLWGNVMKLLKRFDSYEVHHIYRDLNSRADGLANLAMDKQKSGSSD